MENTKTRLFIKKALRFLSYAIELLNESKKKTYAISLEVIRKRLYDPEFRLAIVGDFSCGKSTFLNALIGEELLTTDTLPTTAIPTYIRWNKEELLKQTGRDERRYYNPIVTLMTNNGKTYTLTRSAKKIFEQETKITLPEKIGAAIDTLTTTNSLIGKINRVELTFSEKKMFAHFCLIDTPGINPGAEESKEHILQTQKVLREEADALVVLYPFKDAMTRGTEEFMNNNASHLMAGAIILLTKMDLVPPRQIEKIFHNTERLVKERYGQKNPRVYGVAALPALEYRLGISDTEEDSNWANDFDKTVTEIILQLSDKRTEIVSRRILELMNELIESMTLSISEQLTILEREHEVLETASIERLRAEFNLLWEQYKLNMSDLVNDISDKIIRRINEIVADRREKIFQRIDKAGNVEELNRCLEGDYREIVSDAENKICEEIRQQVVEPLNKRAKDYAEQAVQVLNKYNRYLGAVNAQADTISNEDFQMITVMPKALPDFFIDNHAGKIGAAIATILFTGGLGAIALFVGAFIFDDIRFQNKKDDARKKVAETLNEYEQKITQNTYKSIGDIVGKNLQWTKDLLSEYKEKYLAAFEAVEKAHRERVDKVERKIVQNKDAIERLEELRRESTARAEVKDDTKA